MFILLYKYCDPDLSQVCGWFVFFFGWLGFWFGTPQENDLQLLAVLDKTEEQDKKRIVGNALKVLKHMCDFSVQLVVFTVQAFLSFIVSVVE